MLKLFTLFFIILLTTLTAKTNFSPYHTTVTDVDKRYIYIDDSREFSIGSSGVVLHAFDDTHKTIVSMVTVVDKKDGQAFLKYESFKGLKQNALPTYNITPKKGDRVVLNYLYKRALAVTPNLQTQNYINKTFKTIDWIHPDIFASKLSIDFTPSPKKSDFRKECSDDSFWLLFFAIEDKGYFVDCNSFKILHTITLPEDLKSDKEQKPFYSRLGEIKGRMFGLMGGDGMHSYTRYYKQLLGIQ